MPSPRPNGTSQLTLRTVLSAISYLVQAGLIAIVTMISHWISNQLEVNTQTVIALNSLKERLAERDETYKERWVRLEKIDERIRAIELENAAKKK